MIRFLGGSFLAVLVVVAINLVVGGFCVEYSVEHLFHAHLNYLLAALIGVVGGEFIIPITFIVWLLVLAGVLA